MSPRPQWLGGGRMDLRYLLPLVAVVALGGAALSGRARRTIPIACPGRLPQRVRSQRAGSESELVPGAPVAVTLCRYGHLPALQLVSSRRLAAPPAARHLAAELDVLPRARGAYHCPVDDGRAVLARFVYRAGPDDVLVVGLSGCKLVSNGRVQRVGLDRRVIDDFAALTHPRNGVGLPASGAGG